MKLLKNIVKFIIAVVLLLISICLLPLTFIWGFIETSISVFYKKHFSKGLGTFSGWFLLLPTLIDVIDNVLLQIPFNRILIEENGYQFGNRRDTISYVLGKNKKTKTLKKLGVLLCKFLNFLDKNHCLKSTN